MLTHTWRMADQEKAFSSFSYTSSADSVSSVCSQWLDTKGCTWADLDQGVKVEGADITQLLLNQAIDYFQKGLYNFFAQYILAYRGMATWASVTNYYSSFFSVHSLLCLQGQTITRLSLGGKKDRCQLLPINLTKHEFVFYKKGLSGPEHSAPWNRYYTVYDRYSSSRVQFQIVHKKILGTNPHDESEQRNKINYVPFTGFREMVNHIDMEDFKTKYFAALANPPLGKPLDDYLTTLQALATDPDFQYFARAALRLLFIADILKRFAAVNAGLKIEWDRHLPLWQQFALTAFSDPPQNFFESIPQMLN